MQAELDSLARGIVESVNAIHRTGVTWSGTPPVATNAGDFFASDPLVAAELDPLRTARGIRLDSAVAANASAIAASPATATGPGDSSLALQLSQLRDRPVPFTDSTGATIATESAGDFFRRIATDTAFLARSVGDRAEVDTALTTQADTRRQEVSGVSVDEELVRLIKFQQAYAAAARMIQTVDQMSQTLLDIRR
jgi:flagellar hook-associated protein 1 FlgK